MRATGGNLTGPRGRLALVHTVTQEVLDVDGAVNYEYFNGGLTAVFVPLAAVDTAKPARMATPSGRDR